MFVSIFETTQPILLTFFNRQGVLADLMDCIFLNYVKIAANSTHKIYL